MAEYIDPVYHLTVTLRIAGVLVAYRPSIQLHQRIVAARSLSTCETTGEFPGRHVAHSSSRRRPVDG